MVHTFQDTCTSYLIKICKLIVCSISAKFTRKKDFRDLQIIQYWYWVMHFLPSLYFFEWGQVVLSPLRSVLLLDGLKWHVKDTFSHYITLCQAPSHPSRGHMISVAHKSTPVHICTLSSVCTSKMSIIYVLNWYKSQYCTDLPFSQYGLPSSKWNWLPPIGCLHWQQMKQAGWQVFCRAFTHS